jgi:hypothetical protein
VPKRRSGLESGLHFLQRRGLNKGVLGSSRGWLWIFVVTFGVRQVRKAIGSEYDLVWQGEVKPGEILQIGHLTETYTGKSVRSRRRKIKG